MILLAGIPSEPPLARVAYELELLDVPVVLFNQREAGHGHVEFRLEPGGLHGELRLGDVTHRLEDFAAAYTRLMDDRILPELEGEVPDSPVRTACRELHDTLYRWLEITPARVVNRASAMGSNGSKAYQLQLLARAGFAVPETLVTNDPELVHEFLAEHGRVVYKSVSGSRSIVQELTADDFGRLDDIRWCPVQFQAYVDGVDVRVHVIGERVFATRVSSGAIDYRYAGAGGGEHARLEAIELNDDVAERCVEFTRSLGLRFSGLDLRFPAEGDVVCFEANPCPAYAYYEGHTGQPIAAAVALHLAGAAR
jgi:glutathione synthase/RimK-type ligase-like ATP-grasp enzyme